MHYKKSLGVSKDNDEAAKWYFKAAAGGNVELEESLPLLGDDDMDKAIIRRFHREEERGDTWAQCWLGSWYKEGRG